MMGAGKARTVGTEWLKDVLRCLAFAPSSLAHRAPNATTPRYRIGTVDGLSQSRYCGFNLHRNFQPYE